MNRFIYQTAVFAIGLAGGFIIPTGTAQTLDQIGVTTLRAVTTNLNGTGIRVGQIEGNNGDNGSTNSWEVNPTNVAQPVALFTYTSALGTSTNYPNSVGDWSSHADAVGNAFYGLPNGVATNVAHVDNYEVGYFYNFIINTGAPQNTNVPVVNQSFIFGYVPSQVSVATQQAIDSNYDDYAAQFKTLFVSGAGNGGPASGTVAPPSTCYNGISVGAYASSVSSVGPTVDNGRCKPDITSPGLAGLTSFSTPYVSGAAAVLMQAGLRGDGGGDTNSAADIRMVKALLLNGAVKPVNWTNASSSPLDARYGAGVLNVFNSYQQLAGGKRGSIVSNLVNAGTAHPPTGATGTVSVLSGWDFATNTTATGPFRDAIHHYYFNVTNSSPDTKFTATATLVWNKQYNKTAINNLNLFLYNCANSNLVACSTSLVDNVEHIYKTNLAQGRYDLQVWKAGGSGIVSQAEPYALAFEFFSDTLSLSRSVTNTVITWPVYPAGFLVEATANLIAPNWTTDGLPPAGITNSMNSLLLDATNANQFFRLRRPNF